MRALAVRSMLWKNAIVAVAVIRQRPRVHALVHMLAAGLHAMVMYVRVVVVTVVMMVAVMVVFLVMSVRTGMVLM